jgi:hypothetical protein
MADGNSNGSSMLMPSGDLGRFQHEPPRAIRRRQRSLRGDGQPSRQVREGIAPRSFLLRAYGIEIDDGAAGDAAVADAVQNRVRDPDGHLRAREKLQIRVDLGVGDCRHARAGAALRRRRRVLFNLGELGLKAGRVSFGERFVRAQNRRAGQ